jgi:glutamate/tyrosine decarboxylase-like PLP-dependent enzyme
VARNVKAEGDMRQAGLQGAPHRMTLYASHETHSSVQKAVEIVGLGNDALRRIPVDADHKIDIAALEQVIAADRATGYYPFCIVGNAGTVNVGAFDDLNGLADISEREGLWFHVDGAFGAMAALSPALRHLVTGIERADSLTFDLHKWLHMPMGVGCALMRCEECHRRTFALTPAYFDHADDEQSLTGGPAWFADYGIELTQHFRALKVWMSLKAHGLQKYTHLIEQNTTQAHYLASLIDATPELQRLAPVPLNIVCFRFRADGLGEASLARLNREILVQLHQSGAFALSSTVIHGTYALRVAICNHRSRLDDFEELVSDVVRTGQALALHQASQGKHIFAAAVLANPHMG